MRPLPRQRKSGATRSCSQANIVPVRPNPVATSSAIISTSWRRAELAHRAQEAGRLDPDPGRALDERLDDHRADLAPVQLEHALEPADVAGVDLARLEQQRPVGAVEEVDAADRDRADRVAVVGAGEGDELGPLLAAALAPVLERHLERDLDRGRARLGVEDAVEARRRDLDQPAGELGGARMGEPEHRRVRDPPELVAHGGVDRRVAVAVDVAPQRRDAVDVAVAVGVDQVGALGALDHQRLLALPVELLRERVPEVALIEVGDRIRHRHGRR